MKRFLGGMVLLLACLCLTSAPEAKADTVAVVLNSDGYYASGGYYFLQGSNVAYIRKDNWSWVAGCYRCGYYSAGYWYFTGYSYSPAVLTARTDRQVVLGMMSARAAAQNVMAKDAQEQANTIELIREAGFSGNFSYSGYFGGRLAMPATALPTSNTVWGYQYQQTSDAYGQSNPDLYITLPAQQAARQSDNARVATDQLFAVGGVGLADFGRVALTRERARAAAGVYKATEPPPETHTTTKIGGNGGVVGPLPAADSGVATAFLKLSGPSKCIRCHTGADAKNGFDVSRLPTMSAVEIVGKVLPQLVSEPGKRAKMPPADSGIEPLTAVEVRHFLGGQ